VEVEWIPRNQEDLRDPPRLRLDQALDDRRMELQAAEVVPVVPAKNGRGAAEAAEMLLPTVQPIREAVLQLLVEKRPAEKRGLPLAPVEQRQRGAWRSRRRTVVGFCCEHFRGRKELVV